MITLLTTPAEIQPVYNPIYIRCLSNNTTNYGFKFIFDLYVNGLFVNRVKLSPRPSSTNTIYSPARVLETYLTFDNPINITSGSTAVNAITLYSVKIGEEYGSAATGTTIYSGLTTTTGYTFNAVIQYPDVPTWDYLNYVVATGTTKSFLTNSPSSKLIRDDERETIGIIYTNVSLLYTDVFVNVTITEITGGTINQQKSIYTSISGGTLIHTIGTGIWNLNSWLTTNIDPLLHSKYTVNIVVSDINNDTIASETKTYVLDTQCTKYDVTRFMFLNSLGQFDYFTAKMFNKKNIAIERVRYKKVLDYNYSVGARGRSILNITASQTHSVTSDWITTATSEWLTELFLSQEVYIVENGVIIPIDINNNSIDVKRTENEKLINYTFDYSLSNDINTSRG